ncbi:MAG: hypothetical protein AB2598_02310 [Candidatus Thiodiazotropha sp.]
MPKQIDYPRASMKNCFVLSDAVNDLGGQCSAAMAADKLGKQHTSGAYKALVGAAVKYGLLTNKKGQLTVTQVYRDIRLAYDEAEAKKETQKAFLTPPLFSDIFSRFENKPLPVAHFEKLLIREFDVPEGFASRVSGYFLEGAKQCGLLGDGDILSRDSDDANQIIVNGDGNGAPVESESSSVPLQEISHPAEEEGKFSVRIKGPGMDSLIVVNEEEDLFIVKAMLKKVEKRLAIEDDEWDDA